MLKNYLKIAIRNLFKNKSYVIINTTGLGVALACCIAAYMTLAFNMEFDSFHKDEKVARIFKIHAKIREKDGSMSERITAPIVMAPIVAEEIAGIERYTRYISDNGYMRYGDKAFSEGIRFVDSTFFEMFEFPLVKGSTRNFKNKHSLFLNEQVAAKYFGDEDPVGKTVIFNFPNNKEIAVTVGGVIGKVPLNNTFLADIVLRIEHYIDNYDLKPDSWEAWQQPSTFFELSSSEQAGNISSQLDRYIGTINEMKKDVVVESYTLQPFKASAYSQDNIHSSYIILRLPKGSLVIFSLMAAIILLIACFNLTNTSIAMTAKRLKEVGVRKVVGARRKQIVIQFLIETVLIIALAMMAGLAISQVIVPAFVTMWNLPYSMSDLSGLNLFITLLLLILLSSLLAGMYPALFNSRFKPVVMLKGNVSIRGTNVLTRILVTLQFALSVVVLIAGIVFTQNAHYQENFNFGYDPNMVITVGVQSEEEFKTMKDRIESNPKILAVSACGHHIGYSTYQFPIKVDTAEYVSHLLGVGKGYFRTMGFDLLDGRDIDPENTSDLEEAVIVNKAFIQRAGIQDPLDKIITVHEARRHIVGVVENHVDNLYRTKEPEPFVYYPSVPFAYRMLLVRVNPNDRVEVQRYLEKTWKELFPSTPFDSRFQEDIILAGTKQANANLKATFLFLTFLGGLLSASGIFSLASLNVVRRTKEIGIRKVLGASAKNILTLINREFIIILTIAGLIGGLGGFYLTRGLLDDMYAFHVSVGMFPIVLSAFSIFCVGIFTTSITILKAAGANPVETLKTE